MACADLRCGASGGICLCVCVDMFVCMCGCVWETHCNAPPLCAFLPRHALHQRKCTAAPALTYRLFRCHRDTLVVAFGGGVVGDLAGFVASTYMRGVPVVQVPTTLLAMVDSAIGGKTGLDVPAGKNLVGAFHQPSRVYIDTAVLRTLSLRELRNGFAEIVKVAAIRDAPLFALLEDAVEVLLGQDAPAPAPAPAAAASTVAVPTVTAAAGSAAAAAIVTAATSAAAASLPDAADAVALVPLRARLVACDASAASAVPAADAAGSGVRFDIQLLSASAASVDPLARRPLGGPAVRLINADVATFSSAAVASASAPASASSLTFYVAASATLASTTASAGSAPLLAQLSVRRFADEPLLRRVIAAAAGLKAGIVSGDEREGGARALLNFGHTVGHGLEAVLAPRWLHGECVSVGMVVEAEASRALGVTSPAVAARLRRVLASFGLPVKVPAEISRDGAALAAVFSFMAVDKKNARVSSPGAGAGAGAGSSAGSAMHRDPSLAHDPVQQAVARAAGIAIKCSLLRSIGSTLDVSPARDGALPAEGAAPAAFTHAVPAQLLARLLAAAVSVHPDLPTPSSGLRAFGSASAAARAAAGGILSPVAAAAVAAGAVRIRTPGSKSLSNRALLLAGMAAGRTRITGLLDSDDTTVMLACLRALGAGVTVSPSGDEATVTGTGGRFRVPPPAAQPLYVGNAGTASRFLTALLCLLPYQAGASGSASAAVELRGNSRMHERPIGPLVDALRSQGALIEYRGKHGCPPLRFSAGIAGSASAGASSMPSASPTSASSPIRRVVRLAAKLSSQYVSAVLMAAPYFPPLRSNNGGVGADGAHAAAVAAASSTGEDPDAAVDVVLDEEHPTSLPYIIMTCRTMAQFGVHVTVLADNHFRVPRTPYRPPGTFEAAAPVGGAAGGADHAADAEGHFAVEADASSASYPAAIAAVTGRCVVLEGVGSDSSQGDAAFPLHLRAMGCTVLQDATSTVVWAPGTPGAPADAAPAAATAGLVHADGSYSLRGAGTVDMADTTDCFMTLAAVAAVAEGETTIVGIANQRVKECDRIAATAKELRKVGVVAEELPDGLRIRGLGLRLGKGPITVPVVAVPGSEPSAVRSVGDGDGDGGGDGSCASADADEPVVIHCYDDHRIAMSFAVLSLALRTRRIRSSTPASIAGDVGAGCALVLEDAACTAKTYPEFWDDCEALHPHAWGMTVQGRAPPPAALVDTAPVPVLADGSAAVVGTAAGDSSVGLASVGAAPRSGAHSASVTAAAPTASAGSGSHAPTATACALLPKPQVILFIGMRGAGKSTLAIRAAKVLRQHLERTIARAQAAARIAGQHSSAPLIDAAAAAQALVECVDADEATLRRYGAEAGVRFDAAGASGERHSVTVADIVSDKGWEGFRRLEAEALDDLMSRPYTLRSDVCSDAAAVAASASKAGAACCFRIVACGGGVVETPRCRDALREHVAAGGLVIEVRRSIDDIEASLALAASARHTGDAGRPAYAGGASLRETYARRAPWFAQCSNYTFALAGGDTADWQAAAGDFDGWFARLAVPRVQSVWNLFASDAGAAAAASAAAGSSAPTFRIGTSPWQQLDAHADELLEAAAAGKSLPLRHPMTSLQPPTHFVCLTCPSLWALLPQDQLLEAALRACAVTGAPPPVASASSAQLADLCETAPLHAMQVQASGGGTDLPSPLDRLGDVLYSLTNGAGASGVELRADLLLQSTIKALSTAVESATGESGSPALAAVESRLAYTLALFRRAWRVGFVRRGLASAASDALPRAAVLALPAAFTAPPLIFTLRSTAEGGVFDASGRSGLALYAAICSRALRLGVDCIDIEMGRPRPRPARALAADEDEDDDEAWQDSVAALFAQAATAGVTVIASAHWPGEAAPPAEAALSHAVARITAIVGTAASKIRSMHSDVSAASAHQLSSRALGAVKLIGSGPAASLEDASCRASLRVWIAAMASTERALHASVVSSVRQGSGSGSGGGFPAVPLIGLCMGSSGRVTRVLNQHLTPVTHPALAAAAAPGQLSAAEIMQQRRSLGLLSSPFARHDAAGSVVVADDAPAALAESCRQLMLFGHPVAASPSPAMHGAAFAAAGIAAGGSAPGGFVYGRCDTEKADAVAAMLPSSDGTTMCVVGGNVTIPLKQEVLPLCHALTPEAAAIGAVNTLVALQAGPASGASGARTTVIAGANTDWLGIARPLSLRLQSTGSDNTSALGCPSGTTVRVGLVIGAGGTALAAAFALLALGLTVVVHNPRTPARAQEIVDRFSLKVEGASRKVLAASTLVNADAFAAEVLAAAAGAAMAPHAAAGLDAPSRVAVSAIVSTLPAAAAWTAPAWLLAGAASPLGSSAASAPATAPVHLPVVFDVAYRPRRTALLEQARAAGCPVIEGAEMLVHQGAAAWALWTGREPLRASGAACIALEAAPCLSALAAFLSGSTEPTLSAPLNGARPVVRPDAAATAAAAPGAALVGVPFAEMADAVYAALEASE